jgi:hypothetical protein
MCPTMVMLFMKLFWPVDAPRRQRSTGARITEECVGGAIPIIEYAAVMDLSVYRLVEGGTTPLDEIDHP